MTNLALIFAVVADRTIRQYRVRLPCRVDYVALINLSFLPSQYLNRFCTAIVLYVSIFLCFVAIFTQLVLSSLPVGSQTTDHQEGLYLAYSSELRATCSFVMVSATFGFHSALTKNKLIPAIRVYL